MGMALRRVGSVALGLLLVAPTSTGATFAKRVPAAAAGVVGGFSYGQLQAQTVGGTGCGTNSDGEPSVHASKANLVEVGSERGLGGGSDLWRATQVGGSSSATACQLTYSGQPNAVMSGVGASGGDIDTAFAPVRSSAGTYRLYVASLNLASVNVAVSNDDGKTFSQTPVQGGLPIDDREWIAAQGADTSLLTYHDVASTNIDVLRSDNGGLLYTQIATAIPATDYKASNNQLGNIAIDHANSAPTAGGFWAYQSFVAPSTSTGTTYDEAFLAVSSDGGHTWTDKPIPCSTQFGATGLGHQFPNVSVAPNGTLFYAVSNGKAVYVASSSDHGDTWTCSAPVSTTAEAVMPWIVATSAGEDLVYYGAPTSGTGQTWYVYFAQNPAQSVSGWTTSQLMPVHSGSICQAGVTCTTGRQLLDDFGVDTDQSGWAHIAYSHDSPDLGGSSTYTGYAVQQSGTRVGAPN
jgi:hypothetical protein